MVQTIKFSEMTPGGDLTTNEKTPGLLGGANVLFNNPWTFMASGTTGDRPVPSPAIYFRLRFNTTLEVYEYFDPTVVLWVQLSGTGTGTVNPGTVNDIAFYAANGTAISPVASAPLAVLVSNAGEVPSMSSTLPTGLSIPSAAITASTAALLSGSVVAAPVAGIDLTNKTYVDGLFSSGVTAIVGTTNQVLANGVAGAPQTGAVTLALYQDLATGSTPTFAGLTLSSIPLGVPSGGTGINTFTAYSVICAGTTATGAFQNVSGVGSANQILTSNGAGLLPTWQAASASGSITTLNGDAGSATPTAGAVTISGGTTGLTTSGAASTLNLTGVLKLINGGTNAALVASNGGIFYSTATAGAILSGTSTANQILLSGATSAPAWSTATYPATATGTGTILRANGTNWIASTSTFADTYAASNLLYSNGSNTVTGLATANSATLVTNASGVPLWSSAMTNGQVLIGSTGATPTVATLSSGTGISITNAAGSITISASGSGESWTEVTGTSQALAVNNGYIANNAGLVTLTLPLTAVIGSVITIVGKGAGGWKIAQNASQLIHLGSSVTTTGVGGSLASTNQWDVIEIVCITADTTWSLTSAPQGNITVV